MSIEVEDFAFPCTVYDASLEMMIAYPGMTLRDYFAAKALATDCASTSSSARRATWAYSIADAMLAERAKAQTAQEK